MAATSSVQFPVSRAVALVTGEVIGLAYKAAKRASNTSLVYLNIIGGAFAGIIDVLPMLCCVAFIASVRVIALEAAFLAAG